MCGIFGIILNNDDDIYQLIINGLIQLQNRGYDSAGISLINNDGINVYKYASTNQEDAITKLLKLNIDKTRKIFNGIGHNRWATHGIKNDDNAHPHISNNKKFVLAHNGIIENYTNLKKLLISNGFTFYSQTDTEVIVNLVEYNYIKYTDTFESIKNTISMLKGTFALVIQSLHEPNKLFCVRNGSPMLVGKDDTKVIVTSEQCGFCNLINEYITLDADDICTIQKCNDCITISTSHPYTLNSTLLVKTEKSPAPYQHWTCKEIYEQPNVVLNTISLNNRLVSESNKNIVKLVEFESRINDLKSIDNIIILGCGTSYFAGLYGMYFLKNICNFYTVQVFDGADFNEFDIPKSSSSAFILISQSGETKDLHRCIEIIKKSWYPSITIGIINVVDSLIVREVDCVLYCNAGKEVGVASTKAFTSQVVCLSMLAIWFAQLQDINGEIRENMIRDLHNLSINVKNTIDCCVDKIKDISKKMTANNMFILGKGSDEYIAKEGSLKIKEISYIHAEGYSSSSLKHGPFALLDENFPVIILNLDQKHLAKTLNCNQEVLSRKAPVLFITNNNSILNEITSEYILIPENKTFASLLGIIPIQLLSYYISVNRGINPDKPKNLAKVVTVE